MPNDSDLRLFFGPGGELLDSGGDGDSSGGGGGGGFGGNSIENESVEGYLGGVGLPPVPSPMLSAVPVVADDGDDGHNEQEQRRQKQQQEQSGTEKEKVKEKETETEEKQTDGVSALKAKFNRRQGKQDTGQRKKKMKKLSMAGGAQVIEKLKCTAMIEWDVAMVTVWLRLVTKKCGVQDAVAVKIVSAFEEQKVDGKQLSRLRDVKGLSDIIAGADGGAGMRVRPWVTKKIWRHVVDARKRGKQQN